MGWRGLGGAGGGGNAESYAGKSADGGVIAYSLSSHFQTIALLAERFHLGVAQVIAASTDSHNRAYETGETQLALEAEHVVGFEAEEFRACQSYKHMIYWGMFRKPLRP